MKRFCQTITVVLTAFFLMNSYCLAFSTEGGGHDTITNQAASVVKDGHLGEKNFEEWINDAMTADDEKAGTLLTGAQDEDCTTINKTAMQPIPIPGSTSPIGPNGWGDFFEHFFNPRTGAGLWSNRTAITRAEDYERKIKDVICNSRPRYNLIDEQSRKKVNDYFGRLMHLLQDMGISYHTKLEIHPFKADKPLEHYVETNWTSINSSDLFKEELQNSRYFSGKCIDSTVPMFRLAQWSHGLPANVEYWECINLPSQYCELKTQMVADYATRMAARATKFTEGYINQIWEAINDDCICSPPVTVVGTGHADDTFSVNGSFLGTTQLELSAVERLNFLLRLALKKGDISPLFTKQMMDIYAEAKALPQTAPQESRDEVQARFQSALATLSNLPARDQDEWPDVALLENGYHDEALFLINKANEPVRYVTGDNDPSTLQFNPVLVIPSGGLLGREKSDVFGSFLGEYVKQGGTLIVFAQPYGYHFSILPVPEEQDGATKNINGFGWEEDQNCFADAVYLDGWHQMFAGQSRSTPTMNVDGYFTDYPSNATVLLRRTANGQPAMLSYEYGQGRVIVTSMYSDFAFGQSQASSDERALVRDLIAWAKKPMQIPEVKRGESLSLSLEIENHIDTVATAIKLLIFNPDRSVLISEQNINENIPAYGESQVSVQFTAPSNAQLGIYHIDYMLLNTQGAILQPQTEDDSGRFAVSAPLVNSYKNPDLNFDATTNTELIIPGSDVVFTVHGWNNTQQPRTITVKYVFPHMYLLTKNPSYGVYTWSVEPGKDSGWLTKTFTINSSGTASFTHVMQNAQHDDYMFANFYDENNRLVGRVQRSFFLFHPEVRGSVSSNKSVYVLGETISVNAQFTNLTKTGFPANAKISLVNSFGSTIAETERSVMIPPYGVSRVDTTFIVPEGMSRGKYVVTAILDTQYSHLTTSSIMFDVESPFSRINTTPNLPKSFRIGANNIAFTVTNSWMLPINNGNLEINLQNPHGFSMFQNSYPFTLAPGETKVINTSVTLSELIFGNYALFYSQSDETKTGSFIKIDIPNEALAGLIPDKGAYRAGETLTVAAELFNKGKFELINVECVVAIPELGLSQNQFVSIPTGNKVVLPVSFVLPRTVAPGHYTIHGSIVLPSGDTVTNTSRFNIPQSLLIMTLQGPRAVTSGSLIHLFVENDGGADTQYTGRIFIRDGQGTTVFESNIAGAINVGEKKPLADVEIPSQTAHGKHILTVILQDLVAGSSPSLNVALDITGITASLQAQSSKEVYSLAESIIAFSDIVNGTFPIVSGNLGVTVKTFAGQPGFTHFLPRTGWIEVNPTAAAVSGDGTLYIADYCRILHLDSLWNLIEEWGTCGSDNGQFNGVTGLAIGPDNSVYILDKGNHRVQRFTSYGAFMKAWGGSGFNDGQFLSPDGLALGPDGAVYVGDTNNNRIQKFTANGVFLMKWGYGGTNDGLFNAPSGVAVSPDGSVYVADSGNHRIQRFSGDGIFMARWGSEGSGDGQFLRPRALTVDLDGSVYVGSNRSVQKFTSEGLFVVRGGSFGAKPGQFNEINSLATSPDGSIYAVDSFNGDVQVFDSNLNFISHWGSHGSQNGWFHNPRFVALSHDGYLHVSDFANHRIQKFNERGDFISSVGSEGYGNGEFFLPAGIAINHEGSLFVADFHNHRIQKFDSEGRFERAWGSQGSEDGQFSYPYAIAVNGQNEVYVADRVNCRIQKFDVNGTFMSKWSTGMPEGVAIGPDGSVYVFDHFYLSGWSKRIQKFDGDGNYLLEWEWWSMTDSGGIAVDEQGFVYLANGIFIHKFDPNGNYIEEWEAPDECTGLVVAKNGTLFCTNTNVSRILRYQPKGAKTVFEKNIPLSLNSQAIRQEITSIEKLADPGKYFLHAMLENSLGQMISQSEYPFYVVKDSLILKFSSDKKFYKPNELVIIQGEIQNLTPVAVQGISFAMSQQTNSGSQPVYNANIDIPASGNFPFTINMQAGSEGVYVLAGTLSIGDDIIFEAIDQYEVSAPNITVNLLAPDTAGADGFDIALELKNNGKIDAAVTVASAFDTQSIVIPHGMSQVIIYPNQHITQDMVYTFILSGDVNRTVSKTVNYSLACSIAINVSQIYREGNVAVPISINNTGLSDVSFSLDVSLVPQNLITQRMYAVPLGQFVSDTLFFELTEGDYTLSLTSQAPPANTSASFSVRKEEAAMIAPLIIGRTVGGFITVSTEIVNYGYQAVDGTILLSLLDAGNASVWKFSQAINLPASASSVPVPISLNIFPAALQSGSYTAKMTLLNEGQQELASQVAPLVLTGANLRLAGIPATQTVMTGDVAEFVFGVANVGGMEASAMLTFKSHDFLNLTRRELINPGEEKNIQFVFPVPIDLEEKDYYAEYELKGENGTITKGQVKYHVAGINISVAASLDKNHYGEGETARLAMTINELGGGGTRNLFARVNYGDYDSKQSFSLNGSQNLTFDIPLTAITGEKIFYGIYDEGGRSIHLNSLYIYKAGDAFSITTNKQVYNLGESMSVTIAGSSAGVMTISGPGGYSETFSFNGYAARNIVLPQFARAGTYHIEASLTTTEGQTIGMSKPIDIAGISVKVKEAVLDKGKYLPGDTLRLSMRIDSNTEIPAATMKVWTVDPEKNSTQIGERSISLTRNEQTIVTYDFPVIINSSGVHKTIYGIYANQFLVASGNVSFDAGEGVILGMTTDRSEYPVGSEAVMVRISLFGKGDATLTLNMNNVAVHTEAINLNGFITKTIQLPTPGPGMHKLEGVLEAGGLSNKKETAFLYGTNLPDLVVDVWGSGTAIGKDGMLKLNATAGNRGKTVTTPTSITLHDGAALLSSFSVEGLNAGSSQTYEYLWNVMGKAGEHTLAATVDPGNMVTEFTKENNRVTRQIVIPDIALVTETDRDNYQIGESITVNATTINLTSGTNYPSLTCTTIVRDVAGVIVFRESNILGLTPAQSALTSTTWNTSGQSAEGRYIISQEISSGAAILAERTKNVTLTAGSGLSVVVNPAALRVKQGETGVFTISVNAASNVHVVLNAEGTPEGVFVNLAPDTVTGAGTSALSIATNGTTTTGSYPISIRAQGSDGSTTFVQATLEVTGFSLQVVPPNISITQQEIAEFNVGAESLSGYEGSVTVSDATGGIGGLIVAIANPNLTVPGGQTVVGIQSSKYVPPGAYVVKLTGSDGIIAKDIELPILVIENPDIASGFILTPGPGYDNRGLVMLMNRNFVEKVELTAFNTRFGANAVMGDIDGDGEDEIIVAPGPDPLADGRLKVFRKEGVLLFEQPVFTTKFGARLAAGDIDGDWRDEVVVGAGPGLRNTARVKILSYNGQLLVGTGIDFIAFPDSYKLGVKLALGDVDGDGIMEIIAGAGPSPFSPPRIRVFKINTTGGAGNWSVSSMMSDFKVDFGDWYQYLFGVNVAAGDIDGDGMDEIIAGAGPNPLQKPVVAVYKGDGTFTGTRFEAYPAEDYRFGVNVAARDLDGDGIAEIVTGPGPSPFSESWVRIFKGDGTLLADGFLAFPEATKFGVKVSIGNIGE